MTVRDVEAIVASGHAVTREQAGELLATADLISIGLLGEASRQRRSGDVVTFGRVAVIDGAPAATAFGEAGEVRLAGQPRSVDDARQRTRAAAALISGIPLTGFSLGDLAALVDRDMSALTTLARVLAEDGLSAVGEVPADAFGNADELIAAVEAVGQAGLGAWRVTIARASLDERLELIERVARLQQATHAIRAFAPLPRLDPPEAPSTGYDDVRTVAVSRLMVDVPVIQVDWPLYGPKLAQVAIAFGAGDIDGVAPADSTVEGPRRAAKADIERQIRAASAVPAERNGRYERRS